MNNKVYFTETRPGLFKRNARFKLTSTFEANIQYKEINLVKNISFKEKSAVRNVISAKKNTVINDTHKTWVQQTQTKWMLY